MMKTICCIVALFFAASISAQEPIKVGTIAPAAGPVAEAGAASGAALKAYFDEINSQGGVSGRKLELTIVSYESDAAATLANIKSSLADEKMIAFVGGIMAGQDREIAALIESEKVPLIGAATLTPQIDAPLNRYAFYLLSGLREQARALVNFAASKPEVKKSGTAIIFDDGALSSASALAAEAQARKQGWTNVEKIAVSRVRFDAAALANSLKQRGIANVLFFSSATNSKLLLELLRQSDWVPAIYALNTSFSFESIAILTPAFKDKIFVAFPMVPSDMTAAGSAEYRALQQNYNLPAKHAASQLSSLAAAKLFIEALKRVDANSKLASQNSKLVPPSSMGFQRQKLLEALEGIKDFDTGFGPHLTFAPDRRIGALGADIITFDPESKQLVPIRGWVSAE